MMVNTRAMWSASFLTARPVVVGAMAGSPLRQPLTDGTCCQKNDRRRGLVQRSSASGSLATAAAVEVLGAGRLGNAPRFTIPRPDAFVSSTSSPTT